MGKDVKYIINKSVRDNNDFYRFYNGHSISPVKQNIEDINIHYS